MRKRHHRGGTSSHTSLKWVPAEPTEVQLQPEEPPAAAQHRRFLLWLVFRSPPVGREVDRRGQFTWKILSSDLKGTPELSLKPRGLIIGFYVVIRHSCPFTFVLVFSCLSTVAYFIYFMFFFKSVLIIKRIIKINEMKVSDPSFPHQ